MTSKKGGGTPDIKLIGIGVIVGAIGVIIGLVLLPVLAGFIYGVQYDWNGTAWVEDTNITSIVGLLNLVDLIAYGFTFGLVGLGVGMIAFGFKGGL